MKKIIALIWVLVWLLCFSGCGKTQVVEEAAPSALPPQVMVDGVIYVDTGKESTAADRENGFDGEITSSVMGDERPVENDQSNFGTGYGYQFGEREGTVELYINGRWWIYATNEVSHQISYPEQHMVVDEPPALTVTYGEESIKARFCLSNWEFTREDGTLSALMGDGLHPLMAKHTSPFITLDPTSVEPFEIWLRWDIVPDMVSVNYWSEDCWEELSSGSEYSPSLSGNEAGDSYLLRPKNGNYIYEIVATWQNAPNYGGTVRYSFHTVIEGAEVVKPVSTFADHTWEDIIWACKNDEIPDDWEVGDTKPMTIDGVEYNIMIIGMHQDAYADGSRSTAPLTFQLAECYQTLGQMNPVVTNDACWRDSAMRNTTLPQFLDLMPVKDAIREVQKLTFKGDNSGLETVVDKLFLLSEYEVYGLSNSDATPKEGIQYDYYANGGDAVKVYDGPDDCWWDEYDLGPSWWLRTHSRDHGNGFAAVDWDGNRRGDYSDWYDGIAFAFCF